MMKDKDLQKYLAGVFAIELNVFVLNKTISHLTRQHNSLARHNKLNIPIRGEPKTSLFNCFIGAGIPSGIIVGLIGLITEWNRANNLIDYIASLIAAVIYAVEGLVVGGLVVGFIVFLILRAVENKRLDEEFKERVERYDAEVKRQNARIAREKAQQKSLVNEISSLKSRLAQAKDSLACAYSYDILAPEYRNIYAVSSIHGYLAKGRTHCLEFNEETGDQGAYNIFENERRLDRIITNTEDIIDRFDQVVQYQQELAVGLQEATRKVDSLCANVNTQLNKINGSVSNMEQCQNVIAYNTECAARELEFMNWMNIWC